MHGDVHTTAYRDFRTQMKAIWEPANTPCGICGQATINWQGPKNEPDSFELDHRTSRKRLKAMGRLDLLLDPTNAAPSHSRCNRAKQDGNGPAPVGEMSEDW